MYEDTHEKYISQNEKKRLLASDKYSAAPLAHRKRHGVRILKNTMHVQERMIMMRPGAGKKNEIRWYNHHSYNSTNEYTTINTLYRNDANAISNILSLHQLANVVRARVSPEELRPVHDETVGQQVHNAAAEAERFHPAEALAKHDAGVRSQPDHAQREGRHAHRNACS